jgi:hypothetical protein
VKAVHARAAIGVPPRNQVPETSSGLISMARHTTSPVSAEKQR